MITLTLKDITASSEVMKELVNKSLKGKIAFKIARLLRELDKELTLFNEKRAELVKEYCQRDENGELKTTEDGNVLLMPDKTQDFYKAVEDLLNTEVEINADKINFSDIEDINFTPAQILSIEALIEE